MRELKSTLRREKEEFDMEKVKKEKYLDTE